MNARALKIFAVSLGLGAAAGNLVAQVTLTNLYSFGSLPDAQTPMAGLVQGSDGNFYGTTSEGGSGFAGTVFRISPSGSYSILYSFGSLPDAQEPEAGLVQGNDGNFYGTTSEGGSNVGSGTVFRISPGGSYSNLYSFGNLPDGQSPMAGLAQGNDGNFYGTTSAGGTNGFGTVFRISPGGSYSNLYSFGNLPDGQSPMAGLARGNDGNFYGTTSEGGTNDFGTVFRISPGGSYSNLYSFGSLPDGQSPMAGLVQGSDGNFYGTTSAGGTNGYGTVFRISPGGSYSILYSFGSLPDGQNPMAGLVQGSDGNFYGTTLGGGGTVFRISPSGSYSNLYWLDSLQFQGPKAGLVQGSDGNFYGTTSVGGTNLEGTVFKLTVPLNSPANQISAIHFAGTNVLVSIPSVAAEIYRLQYRTSLTAGAWANVVGGSATSIGGSLTATNFGGFSQPQQFYRFAITP